MDATEDRRGLVGGSVIESDSERKPASRQNTDFYQPAPERVQEDEKGEILAKKSSPYLTQGDRDHCRRNRKSGKRETSNLCILPLVDNGGRVAAAVADVTRLNRRRRRCCNLLERPFEYWLEVYAGCTRIGS